MKIPSKYSVASLVSAGARDLHHIDRRMRESCRDDAKWQERAAQIAQLAEALNSWADELKREHYADMAKPR